MDIGPQVQPQPGNLKGIEEKKQKKCEETSYELKRGRKKKSSLTRTQRTREEKADKTEGEERVKNKKQEKRTEKAEERKGKRK